jgi:hypothetical protein
MLMKCFSCDTVESADFTFSCCQACRNVLYCSRVCQRENWKEHKKICKSLVVGASGSMQVKNSDQTDRSATFDVTCEGLRSLIHLDEDLTQFFKLFQESEPGGRRAAARDMKQIALRQEQDKKMRWLLPILVELYHVDADRLTWASSPLLVLLECMNPTAQVGGISHPILLIWLANLLPSDDNHAYYASQIVLAQQLVAYGVDVNAVLMPQRGVDVNAVLMQQRKTPLHCACCTAGVTNLEFIEFLLQSGADPNARNHLGQTPLMYTTEWAPGAAKVLIEWPATDVKIVDQSGNSMSALVRKVIEKKSGEVDLPENPRRAEDQFVLQHWREVEEMLVEKGACHLGSL